MNPYCCAECAWKYDAWTMGDRNKALKRHRLVHLLTQRDRPTMEEYAISARLVREGLDAADQRTILRQP